MARRQAAPEVVHAPDRTLPHNLDAERSVLGAIMLNNAAYIEAAAALTASDFFRDAHRRIFEAMAELLDRPNGAVDAILLSEALNRRGTLDDVGGPVYLSTLTDGMPRSTNVRYYAGIVRDKSVARRLIYASNKTIAAAYEQDQAIDQVLAAADSELLAIRQGRRGSEAFSLASQTSALFVDLEERVKNRGALTGVDTGFKGVNELLLGWQPGDLIIVAARPSMGKTTFAFNSLVAGVESARKDGRPRTGLGFSMEMNRRQLEFRILSSLSGIPATRLLGGALGPSNSFEWPLLGSALERMHGMRLYIDDQPGRTVIDIRGACRQLAGEEGLDVVVIDYVQLMRGTLDRRGATRTEELTDISRRLKILAGELQVPIIILSQLRRTEGRPKLQDLRESGSLEQDADQVLFLHRSSHKVDGFTELIVEKNRNGPTGTLPLTLHKNILRFEDGGEAPPAEEAAKDEAESKKRAKGRAIARARAGRGLDFPG